MTNPTAATSNITAELAAAKAMRDNALAMLDDIAANERVFGITEVIDATVDETDDETLARLHAEALVDTRDFGGKDSSQNSLGNEALAAIYANVLNTAPGTYADDEGDN